MKLAILLFVGVIAKVYGDEPEAIVGGSNAMPGEFPHQVSLRMGNSHFCGGTIITSNCILTAAHCIPPPSQWPSMTVVTGANQLSQGGQRFLVKNIFSHSGYNPNSPIINFDIALIFLKSPIPFNQYQRPINLASRDHAINGAPAMLSGWGKTSTNGGIPNMLQKLAMSIIPRSQCQAVHGTRAISNNQICAYVARNQGACQGDSGGPLICNNEVVGVVSWGIPCAQGHPDVFTSVYNFLPWIQNILANYK